MNDVVWWWIAVDRGQQAMHGGGGAEGLIIIKLRIGSQKKGGCHQGKACAGLRDVDTFLRFLSDGRLFVSMRIISSLFRLLQDTREQISFL